MVRRAYAHRSVFEILLPDGDKLWAPELRAIDELLDEKTSSTSSPPLSAATR